MLAMTSVLGVSVQDMDDVRRWADEATELAPADEYLATKKAGVVAAFDWVQGVGLAPISRAELEPTRENITWEAQRAVDEESELRRLREHGTYPGSVREALAFVMGRADAPF